MTSSTPACANNPALHWRDRTLCLENVPLQEIAARFGTPSYVYSKAALLNNLRAFQEAFSGLPVVLHYAVKANANLALLRILCQEGIGAEIVSLGELAKARRAGFPPERIVFTGVGKTEEEVKEAVQTGIKAIVVESLEELGILRELARALQTRPGILLRVNPGLDLRTHPHLATASQGSKFGMDPQTIQEVLPKLGRENTLEFLGFHVHVGSQVQEVSPYRGALRILRALGEEARARGLIPRFLDLGGGFAIAYAAEERPFPLGELRALLEAEGPLGVEIGLEPGRALVGSAGILLTKILYKKTVHGRTFLVTDAGMNDFLRPSLYGAKHRILPVQDRGGPWGPVDVVGPICESADVLAKDVLLPDLGRNDLLAVLDVGAYGFSMASQYNSRPRAAEVLVSQGQTHLIRARETLEDLWRGEMLLG
ncbi:MAG: diaminopimelate decarboxylase [Candidatus Bipolaricaulaceae bacterium]